jgi:hypothetical protein
MCDQVEAVGKLVTAVGIIPALLVFILWRVDYTIQRLVSMLSDRLGVDLHKKTKGGTDG